VSEPWLVYRVLLKNSMTLDLKTKKGRRGVLLMAVLALCFVPTLGLLYVSFLEAFRQGTLDTIMLEAGMLIPCLLTVIMGCMVVPTVFYFSRDTQILLPLPLKPGSIVLAKTAMVLSGQLLLGMLFALPVFAAYWTVHPDILRILVSLLILATLPLLPVFAVGAVMMILMRFIPALRDKDRFNLVFGLLTLVMAVGVSLASSSFSASDGELLMEMMQDPQGIALINWVFPQLAWAARSISVLSLSDFCLYLGVTLLALALFLLVANRLFLPAVTTMNSAGRKVTRRTTSRQHSPLVSCMITDNRMLVRTPAWFMNCLLPPFLMVIIFGAMFMIQDLPALLQSMDLTGLGIWMPAAGLVIGLFISSMNMITSTAFSREGQNLWRMKVIPVPVRTQILAKGLLGTAWSAVSCLLFVVLAVWMIRGSALDGLVMLAAALVASVFVNGLGLLVDGWHPKLVWDDDTTAVKNNFNGMIEMFVAWAIILVLFLPLLMFGLFDHILVYSLVVTVVFLLIDLWMVLKGPGLIAGFLENQI